MGFRKKKKSFSTGFDSFFWIQKGVCTHQMTRS